MFSRRLDWACPPNRLSRLLERKRAEGARLLDLTESNPTRVGIPYPEEKIAAALSDPAAATYRPDPRGLRVARRAVAAYYEERGITIEEDRIVLTAGTSESYALLFKLLLDPGDTVLVPEPSYPLFADLASLESVRVRRYPLEYDGRWGVDLGALEGQAGASPGKARAVVIVNPNNPTGQALREDDRIGLERICCARDMAILSDEVFFNYLLTAREPAPGSGSGDGAGRSHAGRDGGGRFVSMASPPPESASGQALAFTLGGLSKSCGMPQMKLGWIVVSGPDPLAKAALEHLDWIADTYLTVGTPVQLSAGTLLEIGAGIRQELLRRIDENRATLLTGVGRDAPCEVLEADGGWYAVLRVPSVMPEEELVLQLLDEDDVLVHPGYFFDFAAEAYLVLSLLPTPPVFGEAVRRILRRCSVV
jgi:aspartate/methionine/tyrosine aminotransferase